MTTMAKPGTLTVLDLTREPDPERQSEPTSDPGAIPAVAVWMSLSVVLDTAAFARTVPMPDPGAPVTLITVADRKGWHSDGHSRRLSAAVSSRAVRRALSAIRTHGPEAVTLRLDGVRPKGDARAELSVTVLTAAAADTETAPPPPPAVPIAAPKAPRGTTEADQQRMADMLLSVFEETP
jgi:hypothetical protein